VSKIYIVRERGTSIWMSYWRKKLLNDLQHCCFEITKDSDQKMNYICVVYCFRNWKVRSFWNVSLCLRVCKLWTTKWEIEWCVFGRNLLTPSIGPYQDLPVCMTLPGPLICRTLPALGTISGKHQHKLLSNVRYIK
jgi:hypothetical protein